MSKTSLALIDVAVQSVVAREMGDTDEALVTETGVGRTRFIAGLRVISNAARDAPTIDGEADRLERLQMYRADREEVTRGLKSVGIEPLAVLPLAAWRNICDRAELFRFIPRGDTVRINGAGLMGEAERLATKQARQHNFKTGCITITGCILVSLSFLALAFFVNNWFGWGAFFSALVTVFAVLYFCDGPSDERIKKLEAMHIRRLVAQHEEKGTLLRQLWPTLREPGGDEGVGIRIDLPRPPPAVQERLIAAERLGLPLRVAVVGEAIAFKEPVADALVDTRAEHWEEIERRNALNPDPIIYIVKGGAVAVIAQYGDFPIEEEVVHRVINSEHLV